MYGYGYFTHGQCPYRSNTYITCTADHSPTLRGVGISRAFSSARIWLALWLPICRAAAPISANRSAETRRPQASSPRLCGGEGCLGPLRDGFGFLLCNGGQDVHYVPIRLGYIAATNSTADSMRFEMKATLRARRSSLAITRVAPCFRQGLRALARAGPDHYVCRSRPPGPPAPGSSLPIQESRTAARRASRPGPLVPCRAVETLR